MNDTTTTEMTNPAEYLEGQMATIAGEALSKAAHLLDHHTAHLAPEDRVTTARRVVMAALDLGLAILDPQTEEDAVGWLDQAEYLANVLADAEPIGPQGPGPYGEPRTLDQQ